MKKIISLLLVLAIFPVMIVSATEEDAIQTEEIIVETKSYFPDGQNPFGLNQNHTIEIFNDENAVNINTLNSIYNLINNKDVKTVYNVWK